MKKVWDKLNNFQKRVIRSMGLLLAGLILLWIAKIISRNPDEKLYISLGIIILLISLFTLGVPGENEKPKDS